jgi:hypothetical protein
MHAAEDRLIRKCFTGQFKAKALEAMQLLSQDAGAGLVLIGK